MKFENIIHAKLSYKNYFNLKSHTKQLRRAGVTLQIYQIL
jgi:hypothetical protein